MKTINFKVSREDLATIRAQAARLVGGGRFKIEVNVRTGWTAPTSERGEYLATFNTQMLPGQHDFDESYSFSEFVKSKLLRHVEVREDDAEETVSLDLCVCTWSRDGWEPDSYIMPTFKNGKLVKIETI